MLALTLILSFNRVLTRKLIPYSLRINSAKLPDYVPVIVLIWYRHRLNVRDCLQLHREPSRKPKPSLALHFPTLHLFTVPRFHPCILAHLKLRPVRRRCRNLTIIITIFLVPQSRIVHLCIFYCLHKKFLVFLVAPIQQLTDIAYFESSLPLPSMSFCVHLQNINSSYKAYAPLITNKYGKVIQTGQS